MSDFSSALVLDDLASSRRWLSEALEQAFPGIRILTAGSLSEAATCIQPPPPLALIDLGLPDGSGIELIERLRDTSLCIVATIFDDDAHLFPALRAGAQGYVLKDQSPQNLADMLRGIAEGRPPLSPSIARRLLQHFQPAEPASPAAPQHEQADQPSLTGRETEVLRLTAKGLTRQEIAGLLELSVHTVAGYLKEIYRKLQVRTRAEATLEAARRGLVR